MVRDRMVQTKPGQSVVRLIVTNWLLGAALGALCAGLLLWLDIGGLRGLMFRPGAETAVGLADNETPFAESG